MSAETIIPPPVYPSFLGNGDRKHFAWLINIPGYSCLITMDGFWKLEIYLVLLLKISNIQATSV